MLIARELSQLSNGIKFTSSFDYLFWMIFSLSNWQTLSSLSYLIIHYPKNNLFKWLIFLDKWYLYLYLYLIREISQSSKLSTYFKGFNEDYFIYFNFIPFHFRFVWLQFCCFIHPFVKTLKFFWEKKSFKIILILKFLLGLKEKDYKTILQWKTKT